MPHRAHRRLTPCLAIVAGCLVMAGVTQAQTAPAGPRYLSWANRPADTTPGDVLAVQSRARTDLIPRRVAPSQAVQRPMIQPTPQTLPASRGLTPASAWIGPRVVPAYAPGNPDPMAYATGDPQPVAEPAPAADPMAPRRDAPIFRLQPQGAAAPASSAQADQTAPQTLAQAAPAPLGQQGARYYSVHRDAGRQPDATVIPDPVFFDSVTLDLAQPPAAEPVTRDARGRRRPVANDDPSLP